MKKKYYDPLFSQNMWAAAKTCSCEKSNYHMSKIQEKCPATIEWLNKNHPYVWKRSKFAEDGKVDYINNNLSKSFISWISKIKSFQIVEMHDKIRQMIITKFNLRSKIGGNMDDRIIQSIIEDVNDQSKVIKDHEMQKVGDGTAGCLSAPPPSISSAPPPRTAMPTRKRKEPRAGSSRPRWWPR
jgi:hypothetical protein